MIVLDTDVLSEVLRPSPDAVVVGWLARQNRDLMFTTAVTQAEILHGVEMLPAGKRRTRLREAVEQMFLSEFPGRVLAFDAEAAELYPRIVSGRDALGRPISQFDALIAAICRLRGAAVATRNVRDFEHCGVKIVNPWEAG